MFVHDRGPAAGAAGCARVVYLSVVPFIHPLELCAGLDGAGTGCGDERFDPGGVLGVSSMRDVSAFTDLSVVIFRSWVIEPGYTLRSTGRPEPASRPLEVYCQNV